MANKEGSEGASAQEAVAGALGAAALLSPFWFWGSSMVTMKAALGDTSPLFVAVDRLLPAGVMLLVAGSVRKEEPPNGADAWLRVLLFGLVDGTMFQGFLAEGLQRTPAGLGSVIIDSQPLTVAIMAALIYRERIPVSAAFGLLLGVLGLALLELPDDVTSPALNADFPRVFAEARADALAYGADSFWQSGELLMLLAAQSMAVGTVMAPWVTRKVGPVTATGWHMLLGALPIAAYSVAKEPQVWLNVPSEVDSIDVLNLAYTSVFGGAVGYGVFFWFASRGNVARLSSLTFFTPIFASITGYLFLGERLTPTQLLGGAITLAGIALVNNRGPKAGSG